MKKLKIVVYAISKNEEKFVNRWYESMKEADEIYVLDTGSTDNTVKSLESLGVHVFKKDINPWRFDVARNESLALVPDDTDICVCTDLDETFNSGWREILEKSWNNSTRMSYIYNWALDESNKPLVTFWYEKIHARRGYKWIYPVHEVLECSLDEEIKNYNDLIVLNHYPDKNKSRSSYLGLLELSLKEDPDNERNLHYLGREYMYYKKWDQSIDTLIKHISVSTWNDEAAASMRFISRCYINKNRINEARMWLQEAIKKAPLRKEAYIELALLELNDFNYHEAINNCLKAKSITQEDLTYITEVFNNDSTIDDILSISYYNLGLKDEALFYIDRALSYDTDNERLLKNKEIFLQ